MRAQKKNNWEFLFESVSFRWRLPKDVHEFFVLRWTCEDKNYWFKGKAKSWWVNTTIFTDNPFCSKKKREKELIDLHFECIERKRKSTKFMISSEWDLKSVWSFREMKSKISSVTKHTRGLENRFIKFTQLLCWFYFWMFFFPWQFCKFSCKPTNLASFSLWSWTSLCVEKKREETSIKRSFWNWPFVFLVSEVQNDNAKKKN